MWTREELKLNAKASLNRNYWPAILVGLIISILGGGGGFGSSFSNTSSSEDIRSSFDGITSVEASVLIAVLVAILAASFILILIGISFSVFVSNPLFIGCYRFFAVNNQSDKNASLNTLGFGFRNKRYGNVVQIMFFRGLFTWLWSLLLIIPGIIKGYEYRMIPYLLAENPNMDRQAAFAASREMMTGEKWNAFVLDLSFLGWILLSIVTCGILALFYVNPYIQFTNAGLYLKLREILINSGKATAFGLDGFTEGVTSVGTV